MANQGVKGRVIDAVTGTGITGLVVTVVDFDPFFNEDDVLKKGTIESTDGSFQFVYPEDSYRLWSIDRNPDIVVQVSLPNGRLLFESKEVKDVTANILDIPEIKIHKNSMEGWLVNHTTLNPENADPVFLFKGNEVKHLVDGDALFPAVTQAAIDAKESINLMGLFFDVNNGFISQFKEEFNQANPPSTNCKDGKQATLEEELKKKTAMNVNVMMTNIPLSADDTVTEVREFFENTNVKTAFFQKGFAVLHSKAIILDGVKAILMGSPLKQFYYSDMRHAIRDARHKGSLNHDVSIQIEGPAVAQINKTFATLWKSTEVPLNIVTQDNIPEKTGDENSSIASVQVLRTMPAANYHPTFPDDETLTHGETGIFEAYQRAIHNAERYIYIENQYFTSPEIIDALVFRMNDTSKSKLEIIIVLPIKPDLPGYPDRHIDNVNKLKVVASSKGHKLGVYTMWSRSETTTSGGNKEFQIMPVYVHSKMAIIDDKWATVGSANLDGTSLNYHEVGLLVSGSLMDKVIAKFKLGDDIGKFLWDAFWYTFFFIFKQMFFSLKTLLAIFFIAYKFIFDFKETMEKIRETLEDVTDIPGIIREVFTRTAQHVVPNRSHQPPRSVEMNLVIYNGIAGQPKNAVIRLLKQRLWEEHLGMIELPGNLLNMPETGELNWVNFWDAQANKNKEAIKNNQSMPSADAPVILIWRPEADAKPYLKDLGIRSKNLRDKADVFLFDKCKFDDNKKAYSMADNVVQKITAGTGELLSYLAEIQNNLTEAKAFINLMGWELPPGLDDVGLATIDLGDFVQKLDAVTGAPDEVWEDEIAMIGRITDLALAVNNLVTAIITLANELPTILTGFPDYVDKTNIHKELPRRLFDFLLTNYLARTSPITYAVLHLVNIIDYPHFGADPANFQVEHIRATVNYHHFKTLFKDPGKLAEEAYGWNTPDYDPTVLLQRIQLLFQALGLRSRMQPLDKRAEAIWTKRTVTETVPMPQMITFLFEERGAIAGIRVGLSIFGARPTSPGASDGGMGMVPIVRGQVQGSLPLFRFSDTFLDFSGEAEVLKSIAIILRPNKDLEVSTASGFNEAITGRLAIGLRHGSPDSEPKTLLAFPGGAKVQFKAMTIAGGIQNRSGKPQSFMEISLLGCGLILSLSEADGFLRSSISQEKIEGSFDIKIGWTSDDGIYFEGSGGLEISLATHIQLGPFRVDALQLGLKTEDENLALEVSASGSLTLGPVKAVVDRIGLNVDLSFGSGNLGFFGLSPGFKPPNGIGLSIDTGIVKGGGFLFFDFDKGEYAGALELVIQNTIQVAAIGIINTKFPDGTKGFSLLIVVAVQFTPGIALGMGFFLNGLGGLLGINRTINVPALREGVKNNAIEHIMFPEDVVANINTLLPQIRLIFPIQKDQFMIGFMAKITWGVPALITIEFGLIIEFTNPVRIAILGVLKIALPTEEAAILQLQVNFVGIIDFEKGYLSFDASLYNSRILTFTLEGDMALRLNWGSSKGFLMSVGGFHPAFKPPQELNVPKLKRLTLTILSGNPNLVLTSYFAITSNTVQFGARIDFRFKKGSLSVVGYLQFDVLFQFSPFRFLCNISAGLEVKAGSSTLFSIKLDFELSGPTPWNAKGTASFSILFFTFKIRFNVTWGEAQEVIEPGIAVLPRLLEAMTLDANWTTELPTNRFNLVTLANIQAQTGQIVMQSFGAMKVSQTIMPLNIEINKFGNSPLADIKFANVSAFRLGSTNMSLDEVKESFAPSVYKEMSDDDKLKSPSYTQEKGGAKIADTNVLFVDYGFNRDVVYEVKISDFDPFPDPQPFEINMDMFRLMVRGGAISNSALSKENRQKGFVLNNAAVDIAEEQFVIVNNATLAQHGANVFAGGSQAQANDALVSILASKPGLAGKISIASAYQVGG